MLACPADAPGVRIENTWDALGMQATGTDTLVLGRVFVSSDAFRPALFANIERQTLSFASVHLGLARRAFREAVEILRRRSLGAVAGTEDVALWNAPRVQTGLSKIRLVIESAASVIEHSSHALNTGEGLPTDIRERRAMLEIPEVTATENATEIVKIAIRLVVGGSFRRG